MSDKDDLTPEQELRITGKLLGISHRSSPVVETKRKPKLGPPKATPHFEFDQRPDPYGEGDYDEFPIFLVCGKERVQVGLEERREAAEKIRRQIEAMGVRADWVLY